MRPNYMNRVYNSFSDISQKESRVFFIHISYAIIEGFILGVFSLNEFIYSKTMQCSDFKLGLLLSLATYALLLSVFFNEFTKRFANKKQLLKIVAFVTRLPLLLLLLFPHDASSLIGNVAYHNLFLLIFFIYFLSMPIVSPLINQLLKGNYQPERFGKLYSYATSLQLLITFLSSFGFGILLDLDETAFIYLYPIIGFLGILSIFLISKIAINGIANKLVARDSILVAVKSSLIISYKILKRDKAYRHFQIAFMFYGMGFLMSLGVIIIFLSDILQLSYSNIAIYRGTPVIISMIVLPISGIIMDKMDPRKSAILAYSFLFLFFAFIILTYIIPTHYTIFNFELYYLLFPAYIFFGLFSGFLSLLWNIGSAYFCKLEDVAIYQSIHLSLTGIRGVVAPLTGVFLYNVIGLNGALLCSMLCLLVAITIMYFSYKTTPLDNNK